MPSSTSNHDAHDYAERIRERLPRRLQELRELRERAGLSMYALAKKAGVSGDMVGCIEEGASIPTLPFVSVAWLHAAVSERIGRWLANTS